MPQLADYTPWAGPWLPNEPWPTDAQLLALAKEAGFHVAGPGTLQEAFINAMKRVRLETARACARLTDDQGMHNTVGQLYGFAATPYAMCLQCGQRADHHGKCGC